MRPRFSSGVREGLNTLIARAGPPMTQNEIKAANYVQFHANIKTLRNKRNAGSFGSRKRKRK